MAAYQSNPYTSFHELLDALKGHPQLIETQVKNLSDKARSLGTSQDTVELRAAIDQDERRLHNLYTKTKAISQKLVDEMNLKRKDLSRNDLDTVKRVIDAIGTASKKYEDIVKEIAKQRQKYPNPAGATLIDMGHDNETDDDIHRILQLQKQIRVANDLLVQENEQQFAIEEEINIVQADVIQINHIMRDIGAIVSEQSPIIANIEREVTEANDHIVAGNQQLNSAASHQKNYRKKLCWLLLIFFVIAVIVAIVLIIKLR